MPLSIDIEKVPIFEDLNQNNDKKVIIKTKVSLDKLEDFLNKILDKYHEKCKYFVNLNEIYYGISFNVGIEQINAMIQTMFYLYIYKDTNGQSIIKIVSEDQEHPEWKDIKKDLITSLHYTS
jgi:hypothetical protein